MDWTKNLTRIQILGYVAVGLLVLVMLLQLMLAAGILPITMAWGGRYTELTPALRFSSLIAIILLCYFAYVIARRSGILGSAPPSIVIKVLSWLVTAYLVFNTVMNFTSKSQGERWIFGPITLILVVLGVIISLSRPETEVE
jgi:hypothetical protein